MAGTVFCNAMQFLERDGKPSQTGKRVLGEQEVSELKYLIDQARGRRGFCHRGGQAFYRPSPGEVVLLNDDLETVREEGMWKDVSITTKGLQPVRGLD